IDLGGAQLDASSAGGSITLGNFTATGTVTANAGGSVLINGLISFENAGAGDSLNITAGNAIELNTDTGSVVMTDSAGNPAGALNLTAPNIWVGDTALLSQLESTPDFEG